jgi:superfamily II DNA or RNA helicase
MTKRFDIVGELGRAEARLAELDAERDCLRVRIEAMRAATQAPRAPTIAVPPRVADHAPAATTKAEKVTLFASLFRGRTDVYPRRWENARTGKTGYAPHCSNDWKRGVCQKPKVKCGACPARAFVPMTEQTLLAHLQGEIVAGVYPLLEDDRCWFVAADFDEGAWQDDVSVFAETSREVGLPVAIERSRSGRGAHAWFFFDDAVPAIAARQMASYLLTESMSRRPAITMASYDRLFPNQDTLPRGGFGNLIALPLQREPRKAGNTEFVDHALVPHADQWSYLAKIPRIPADTVALVARDAQRTGRVLGVRFAPISDDDAPWSRPPSLARERVAIAGPLPATLHVVLAQRVFVERDGIPPAVATEIRRLASFQNPVFFEKQAMRFSTGGIPRIVTCAEESERHLSLPRGCLPDLRELAAAHGIRVEVQDERFGGRPLDVRFQGTLAGEQPRAASALLAHDTGVLVAPPGTGKTVLAAHLIAERGVNTLVLVHRKPLVDQWVERLSAFLGLGRGDIGVVGGGKRKPTGRIDVAMIQSLLREGKVQDLVADYGHVIVDECHHVSASSFERVLSEVKARYVLGLTATPRRRDGHHPIVEMQLGPTRMVVDGRGQAATRGFEQKLFVRDTMFTAEWSRSEGIQALYAKLAADEARNALIIDDTIAALESGRSPLLLTERRDHLEYLARRLRPAARHLVVLHGGMKPKDRREALAQLAEIPATEERAVIATGRYIGEGFDDPRLDTLVLAMPIAWRGTLVQYAGRLQRQHAGKIELRVYDYDDAKAPVLAKMFQKRLRGYRALGYEPTVDERAVRPPRELTIDYEEGAGRLPAKRMSP